MKKCQQCSKPATLHITEIREGEVQALHLCESCAQEYWHSELESSETEDASNSPFPMSMVEDELEELDSLSCPNCGISFKQFRAQGRLGCPHDYVAFEAELLPLLENIHGDTAQHCGKAPKRAPDASQRQYRLIRLRNDLRSAVDMENYEEAAQIRDEISELEQELGEITDTTE
ncbi:MAG: DNA helicase UvrBC [Planctomycetaceae bacterium]|nr:DNA helicase UvrBC [Planctomycetaceae bacterium]